MPALKVIINTVYDMDGYREAAKAAGGYILKKSINGDLILAIKAVFESKSSLLNNELLGKSDHGN
jgi:DNA-binding NarL/FixJ family response regulator